MLKLFKNTVKIRKILRWPIGKKVVPRAATGKSPPAKNTPGPLGVPEGVFKGVRPPKTEKSCFEPYFWRKKFLSFLGSFETLIQSPTVPKNWELTLFWSIFGPKAAKLSSGKKNLPHSVFFILLQKSIISDPFYSLIFQKPGILPLPLSEAT